MILKKAIRKNLASSFRSQFVEEFKKGFDEWHDTGIPLGKYSTKLIPFASTYK